MAYYIDDQAKERRESGSTHSESEGEMSDVIPYLGSQVISYQKQVGLGKKARRIEESGSSSSSESDDDESTYSKKRGKENKKGKLLPKRRKPQSGCELEHSVLSELKKANELMTCLAQKMKRHDSRLKAIENKLSESTPSCTSSSGCDVTPKRSSVTKDIPCEVRRESRRVYNLLLEDEDNQFEGWKIEPGITFKDPHNQSVLNVLIQEVKGLNPAFLTQHIKEAAYRFYRSRNEDVSSKRRGTFEGKSKAKRRHERLFRKLQDRKKMFEAGNYKDSGEKEAWRKILTKDFMSSDESCVEDGQEVLVSKPLPWQSQTVSHFKQALDEATRDHKSPLAKRQMKPRRRGLSSSRPKPCGEFPSWAFGQSDQ